MSDHDDFRLEPTEGQRTGGPPGDRLIVGLALFALVAGLLIALGNFVGERAGVSSDSPTPSPSASSSPTAVWPVATPYLLRELTLQPGAVPTAAPSEQSYFTGGIRPKADLVVRANPDVESIQLGVLPQGTLAYAEESPDQPPGEMGWLHILAPRPEGWVASTEGGAELVERLAPAPVPSSGDIWGVSGGGDRFLAVGWQNDASSQLSKPLTAMSADGNAWQRVDLPASTNYAFVVSWGPSGWIAFDAGGNSGELLSLWRSNDGASWTALGTMSDSFGLYPQQLVGSDAGYLLLMSEGRGPDASFWFSDDGVIWRETAGAGLSGGAWVRLAAGPSGFYAWEVGQRTPSSEAIAVYSANGRTWTPVTGGPEGESAQIVAVGGQWVGTDRDPDSGRPRAWVGEVAGDRLTWRPESDEGAFGESVITTMVSDGRRAVAFGWDRATERPMAWIREGAVWRRSPLPLTFGGIPRLAAGTREGVVVVGYRPTLRQQNPVFWGQTPDGHWAPEADPLLTLVPDPPSEECGAPPATAADFVLVERALAVTCLGDTPVSFRAWSLNCVGCFEDLPRVTATPAWLVTPGGDQLALSPIEGFADWWAPVVLNPALKRDPAWTGTWVDVTGHFDDPAAKDCQSPPRAEEQLYYGGRQQVIDGCRQQFVVTAVTPVAGP
jgi:hypothetical protein